MYIQVFIDGSARNQGTKKRKKAACAVVIYKSGKEIVRFARGLGDRTNNEAEYEALIAALLICSMAEIPSPTIYSDSAVVVNHTNGKWICRSSVLLPYYLTIQELKSVYPFQLIQVPRSKVSVADSLCQVFLDRLNEQERQIYLLEKKSKD